MKTLIPILESKVSDKPRLARLERKVIALLKPEFPIGMQHHIKALWHKDRIDRVLQGKPETVTPVTVEFVPSLECNLGCATCTYRLWKIRTKEEMGQRMMSYPVMTGLLDKIDDAGVSGVIFTGGGEPLTNPRTIDALKYAAKKKFETGLFTNGTLFDESNIHEFAGAGISFVRVSFDTADEQNYLRFHCVDDLEKIRRAKENIRLLAKILAGTDTGFGLGVIVNGVNVEHMRSVALFAREILDKDPNSHIGSIVYRPVLNYGQIKCDMTKQISPEVARRALENFKEVQKLLSGYPINTIIAEDYFLDAASGRPIGGKGCKSCTGHAWAGSIAYDGKFYLCSERDGNPDFELGDLNRQMISEIWESERRMAVISRIGECPPTCKIHRTNVLLGVLTSEGVLEKMDIQELQDFLDIIRNAGDPGGIGFL